MNESEPEELTEGTAVYVREGQDPLASGWREATVTGSAVVGDRLMDGATFERVYALDYDYRMYPRHMLFTADEWGRVMEEQIAELQGVLSRLKCFNASQG